MAAWNVLRWIDDVREDLRRMGVTKRRIRAHRRDDRKMVVKEAKVLQGLQSHGIIVVYIVGFNDIYIQGVSRL